MLKSSISQLEQMLQSMFIMARLDQLPRFVSNRVAVRALVEDLLLEIGNMAFDKQVEFTYELASDLPDIEGHSSELQLALYHIARNAVQHTPGGGSIRLTARAQDGQVIIEISDTGEGIPEEHLPRIFERFYRVDKARTLIGSRNGMGLAIARKVIEKHAGEIAVHSEVGKGTVFTVTLPGVPRSIEDGEHLPA
jgi:signal transduction histidine kinase